MSELEFKFKKFSISQGQHGMKVGTDGVLLGAWADLTGCKTILDIGTGTGIIAIMAAQRNAKAMITAIEIMPEAAHQAMANTEASPWGRRINVLCTDVREYSPASSPDAILCNPPYFQRSLTSPDKNRNLSRHDCSLSFEELVNCAVRMSSDLTRFNIILPFVSFGTFTGIAAESGLHLQRMTQVFTRQGKPAKRVLASFGKRHIDGEQDTLTLEDNQGKATAEYVRLVKDFYLKF